MNSENKAYRKVLEHRRTCKKWGKEFCLDCFGGGLSRFVDSYNDEEHIELGLPTAEEMMRRTLKFQKEMEEIKKMARGKQ